MENGCFGVSEMGLKWVDWGEVGWRGWGEMGG